jgi:hypothetical protein
MRKEEAMKKGTMMVVLSVLVFTVWCAAPAGAASDTRVKVHGVLTSVESDGTIVIDDKGYDVDSSARILDGQGKKTSLDKLGLPVKVQFELIYTQRGPIIKLIREVPQ